MTNVSEDVRHELLAVLLDAIENDRYPSGTMMDHVEQLLRPEEVPDYADVLLDKIRADQFPSHDLVRRVRALS